VPEPRVGTVTFLFTDVEGSTRLVRQLRDRYPAVLEDHRRLVREAFSRHGGEEVDTQGDAFFYVFSRARDAAAAAADAQLALQAHAWPEDAELRVRMGMHTGESVMSEERHHGLGVHRAARIMAAGHGGQILASQATAAILADDEVPGVEPRELGEFQLKDVDRSEHLYQLDVEGLPTTFPPLRTGDAPTAYAGKEEELVEAAAGAHRPLHRRPLVIGALAGVLAAAVAIPVFALGRGSDGGADALERVQDNAVGVVDATSRAIIDEAAEIASPQRVAAGEGAIWVTSSSGGGSVVRLDPQSHDVTDTIEVGNGPVGIAVGAGAVWVANTLDGTVSRIDPATGQVVSTIPVGNTPTAVAFGAGAVWVTNVDDRSVSKIDPVADAVRKTIDVDAAGRGIAVGDGAVWVTDPVGNALVRIDARSARVTDTIDVGSGPTAVAYGNGAVWVTNGLDGKVSLIDARQATVTDTFPVGAAPNGVAVAPDGVWVTDEVGGTLVHLDRASRETAVTTLGGRPEGVTLADGSLWIAVQAAGAAHRGGTLRMVAEPNTIDSIDPARSYVAWQLLGVVSDGLVGFKRVGGTDGNTLVPDLASALPVPTDNGRTYTFRLREGIKFADGRELKASAVRYSLERLFRANPARPDFYEGIVGGPACRKQPERCDLSRGVVTDDDTGIVTIRLRAPDPEFLYKLALPFASVVPTGTPATGERPVLGTGPYRIAEYKLNRRVRLVRNHHFKEWSKAAQPEGIPNEIVLELGGTVDARLTAVQRGRADLTLDVPQDRLQEARTRYAAQLHVTPGAATLYLVLNTKRPPFDDVRARRAVAYAVDRGRLVDDLGGTDAPTCQLLPPNYPAYRRYCPHTVRPTEGGAWTAPDLERAHKLVAESGTKGMRVDMLGVAGEGTFSGSLSAMTTVLDETLRQLGYRTSVRRLPGYGRYFSAYFASVPRVEAALGAWQADYPAPSSMLGVLACSNSPYSCDPAVDRKLRETLELQTRNPQEANEAWARLERKLIDQAIVVPVLTPKATDFVSKRVGNYQRHPVFGILISQVWVR
jgi:YVTN family beta-propeller protein